MKIAIYYGGRGLIDDPTLYVINKMQEVLEELVIFQKDAGRLWQINFIFVPDL